MLSHWKTIASQSLRALTWVYFVLLFGWGIAHSLWGDRFWWLFILNSFAVYLFAPLPVTLLLGVLLRRRAILLLTTLAITWGVLLFGGAYSSKSIAPVAGRELTVMTYNVLGFNLQVDAVVQAIAESDADVVAIYELNPQLAAALKASLSDKYPFQVLDPQDSVFGSGVISRYPLEESADRLPGEWTGTPHILRLDLHGESVTILTAHPYATNLHLPADMQRTIAMRDIQARTLKEYVEAHPGPLIAPLDLNATPNNTPYHILTSVLQDSWAEAGWGLGHTFPGAGSPGSSRRRALGLMVPRWLVRIDYVFHSAHFQAVEAKIGPFDGYSDHRPVLARLVLKGD